MQNKRTASRAHSTMIEHVVKESKFIGKIRVKMEEFHIIEMALKTPTCICARAHIIVSVYCLQSHDIHGCAHMCILPFDV